MAAVTALSKAPPATFIMTKVFQFPRHGTLLSTSFPQCSDLVKCLNFLPFTAMVFLELFQKSQFFSPVTESICYSHLYVVTGKDAFSQDFCSDLFVSLCHILLMLFSLWIESVLAY